MKLAKKTLSVALAAVMAASSFAGAFSAFAAPTATAVAPSAVKYTAINGTATVKPNVTIDNQYHKLKSELTTEEAKTANKLAQVDTTTLSTYYSFTPAKTGYYKMTVESTPVYYGYSEALYQKYNTPQYTEETRLEACHVYASKPDGLYSDPTFAKDKALTEKDAVDSITISNITTEDKDDVARDPFVVKTTDTSSTNGKDTHVLSYKYTQFQNNDYIIPDKTVDEKWTTLDVDLESSLLEAGKTYYFKATLNQDTVIDTEEKKTADGKDYYVNTIKSTAAPSAKITISQIKGMDYDVDYVTVPEKDYQVIECPKGTSIEIKGTTYVSAYDAKLGKSVVKLPVEKAEACADYYGDATSATVNDTYNGAPVTYFCNHFRGLQSITLGKDVETVDGLDIAPQLKSVTIKNPEFTAFGTLGVDFDKVTFTVPSNSPAYVAAIYSGYKVNVTCAHKWTTVKAATIFAAGQRKCSECDKVEAIAKVKFAPTAKASGKKIVCKGNAGKVAKLAVWVYDSKGKLVKKQVKKNVTKNTVKVAKAGKYTVKVKAYGPNGAKTASVKKTVKVK